jgi:Flp pilus assembly protein TadD
MRTSRALVLMIAFAVLGTSCATDPETARREAMEQGNFYMEGKKYADAVISYRNAVRADERSGEARLKLSQAYLAVGDSRGALRESVRAADLMPDSVDAQMQAGFLLLVAGQYPEARARAVSALAKEPKNPRALVLLGNALAGLKDIDAAIEQVEQAIDEDPQFTLSYMNLGALRMAQGDREAAESAFRQAVEAAPQSAQAHLGLANFLWAVGSRAEAEPEIKAALAIEPASMAANRAMAAFYIGQGKGADAEPYLKAYVQSNGTVDARLMLADYYVRERRISEATSVLLPLAKEPGGFAPATLRLAALDFIGRRPAEAHKKVDAVLAREPQNQGALETRARFLLREGKARDALAAADALAKLNPRSPRGHWVRGLALEETGSTEEAIKAFQAALGVAPTSSAVQGKLAALYLAIGNSRDALQLAQQVVKAQPQSGAARFLHARAMFRTGDVANAERELLALAKAAPNSAEIHTWVGMVLESKKDTRGARRSFESALELEPNSDVALAGLVSADLAEGRPAAALGRIESQLAKSPNDTRLLMMSGMAYTSIRDMAKAEAAYRKLLELDPNNIDAYGRLGAIYFSQNRLDEARKSFEELAQRPGGAPVAAETMLGTLLLRQNKPAEARKHFERALQINPRAAVAANNLAWDYATNGGNLDTALQLAQTAKAELPDNASVADTLGWVYYQKGLTSLAVSTLKEAVTLNAINPSFHYHLGLAYLKNGNKAEARSTLERVLKLSPSFPAAEDVRRTLATIEG